MSSLGSTTPSPPYPSTESTRSISFRERSSLNASQTGFVFSVSSPSPFGVYISVTMALTPPTTPYAQTIQTALETALARNATTPLGRVLTTSSAFIRVPVELDGAPYTCKRIAFRFPRFHQSLSPHSFQPVYFHLP